MYTIYGATKPPQTKPCLDSVLRTCRVCKVPACKNTQERADRCGKWNVINSHIQYMAPRSQGMHYFKMLILKTRRLSVKISRGSAEDKAAVVMELDEQPYIIIGCHEVNVWVFNDGADMVSQQELW